MRHFKGIQHTHLIKGLKNRRYASKEQTHMGIAQCASAKFKCKLTKRILTIKMNNYCLIM